MTCDMSSLFARMHTTGSPCTPFGPVVYSYDARFSTNRPSIHRMLHQNTTSCSVSGRCNSVQQGCLAVVTSLVLLTTPVSPGIATEEILLDTSDVGASTSSYSQQQQQQQEQVGDNRELSLAETIQWLNTVTAKATDELNEIHPPPLKDLVANARDSNVVQEIQGVTKVFGSVASDLKDGFVGLNKTIVSGLGTENSDPPQPPVDPPAKPETTTAAV